MPTYATNFIGMSPFFRSINLIGICFKCNIAIPYNDVIGFSQINLKNEYR